MVKPKRMEGEPRATDFVESLDRGLLLLQVFGESAAPMSVPVMAQSRFVSW